MKQNLERLETFLGYLPQGLHTAFEFRHPSWFDDAVFAALTSRNAALVINDSGDEENDSPFVRTADWGYLRLRRKSYDRRALESWAERLADPAWQRAFVFFKHEEEGTGPRLATQLAELLDRPSSGPC